MLRRNIYAQGCVRKLVVLQHIPSGGQEKSFSARLFVWNIAVVHQNSMKTQTDILLL